MAVYRVCSLPLAVYNSGLEPSQDESQNNTIVEHLQEEADKPTSGRPRKSNHQEPNENSQSIADIVNSAKESSERSSGLWTCHVSNVTIHMPTSSLLAMAIL
jgi:hypothetical protein